MPFVFRFHRSMTGAAIVSMAGALTFSGCAHVGPPLTPVVLGVAMRLATGRLPDTVLFRRSVTRAGRDSSAGTRTVVVQSRRSPNGGRLIEVERFPGGGGTIVDTAVADLATLKALAHSSHQPSRTMRFAFSATAADGEVTTAGAAPGPAPRVESVHQELGGAIFDSNVIELVVAALPLRDGLDVELPFFIYERGGRVPMRVAVRERATTSFPVLGARNAWVVSVGVPGAPATVWVDSRTRAVLRTRYDIVAQNLSFTDDRVTPLGRDGA
jgi:hypothetical protein